MAEYTAQAQIDAIENIEIQQPNFSVENRQPVFIPKVYGALELLCMEIPPTKWIIPGMLPAGVIHFAGKEKSFKSFAALGLCLAVSKGNEYLGFRTHKSQALYIALEDSETRIRERLELLNGEYPINSNDLKIITGNNLTDMSGRPITLNNGFDKTLPALLDIYPEVDLIVIDVFSRIRSKRGSDDNYTWDYKDVGQLKRIADQFGVAIIIINHTVKGDVYKNDLDSARGSGINAAADCIWILKKETDYSGELIITGRDVEIQNYNIQFDKDNYVWRRYDSSDDVRRKKLRAEYENTNIRQTLEAITKYSVKWEGTPTQFKNASIETGTPIPMKVNEIGTALNKYVHLLREDGYTFTKEKLHSMKYTFINHNHNK